MINKIKPVALGLFTILLASIGFGIILGWLDDSVIMLSQNDVRDKFFIVLGTFAIVLGCVATAYFSEKGVFLNVLFLYLINLTISLIISIQFYKDDPYPTWYYPLTFFAAMSVSLCWVIFGRNDEQYKLNDGYEK
mgnify:CR=1 FL=1|jgi:UDP-N-acetylmuramyl pentapeptide phosphotransferase/UDP-N-acetylglucosamine-1-phosphate transferase